MPAAALILFYLLIALAPLALAAGSGRPPRPVMDEIASGMAMVGFAILLMEFVLSGRFRSISGRVGLDVTMRFHQLLARTALVLALAHPFLYTLPFAAEGLATGVLAFALLPAFVILSIARDRIGWRYETWRLAHGLGALAIAVLVLVHARHAGRYSADPQLAGLWAVLTAAAVLSLAHVYLVKPLLARRRPWGVTGLRQLAERTWEVVLSPRGHEGISYRAGQFAWIRIGAPVFSLRENPFSIASAPGEGKDLRFVIKELGDFTATLSGIPLGTRAHVDGPHGNLVLEGRQGSGIAFIAGGVGIAPMLSLLRQLEIDGDPRPTVLVYGNRHAGQIACTEDLARMRRQHRTEVVQVLSEPPDGWEGERGMVDPALIARLFTEARHRDWLYVLCGPAPMMEGVEEALLDLGVAPRQIISERFQHD
ncbi:ferredoxin reductase family protein [Stappia indica]|uniref:Predicted ferric reductase n=1 Tax=Stappia indica TaxID=538381 RepID=A0A285RU56_9HYPH|nr:ferredoxin reductase family protein [Stappia indica]SOB95817.1 Predicted ferric reductase [Stappia indica]